MTKLLVRAANNERKTQLGLVNTLDYMPFVDILGDWLGWSFTIVATDRYTRDMEYEATLREQVRAKWAEIITISVMPDDTAVDWHDLAQQHPIEPTSSSDEPVIGD